MRTLYRAVYVGLLIYAWMLLLFGLTGGAPGWVFAVVLACGVLGGLLAAAELAWDAARRRRDRHTPEGD